MFQNCYAMAKGLSIILSNPCISTQPACDVEEAN